MSSSRIGVRHGLIDASTGGAALAFLLSGAAAAGPSPQASTPVFGSGIEVVRLDVIVLDREGRPVTGLVAADFTIEEDGRQQAVTTFEPVVVAQSPPAAASFEAPRVSENRLRAPSDGRCLFLFFNDVHVTPVVAQYVRSALVRFLDQDVREGDWVTLMAPEQQLWWTARHGWEYRQLRTVVASLKGQYVRDPFQDGVSDWEAICQEEYGFDVAKCKVGGESAAAKARVRRYAFKPVLPPGADAGSLVGDPAAGGTLDAEEKSAVAKRRTSITLDGLRQALDSLAPLRGHKSVVLISEGFVLLPKMPGYAALLDAARRANVAIHFLDPRGLESGVGADMQDAPATFQGTRRELEAAGSGDLADTTGGHSFASNDPVIGLRQVATESEAYYLLGYAPDGTRAGERKIRVRVRRGGSSVRSRSRYFVARKEDAARETAKGKKTADLTGFDAPAVAAMRALPDATDFPLRTATLFFEANSKGEVTTLLAAELTVPVGPSGKRSFRVASEARRATGGPPVHDQFDALVETLPGASVVLSRQWRLPAGVWQVRVLVEDATVGRIGTAVHTFEVPDPKVFRISTPLLTNQLEADSSGTKRPRLSLDRFFAASGVLYCQYSVQGARPGPAGPANVTAGWELRQGEDLVRETGATPIQPTPDGRLVRTVGVSLDGLEPGRYELTLVVKDEGPGAAIRRSEAFSIEPRPAVVRGDEEHLPGRP